MFSMTVSDFLLSMAAVLMVVGVIVLGVGVYVLVSKMFGKDIRTIAEQTTKLAQKGITEDVTGLVGNARTLIETLNEMTKTTAGVGVFLILLGVALMAGAYALVLQIK
jgi:nitrogen fixation/metabolism regulation signal transduction histidine kinase